MFCSNCGKQIMDNAHFCKYCGSTQDDDFSANQTSDISKTNVSENSNNSRFSKEEQTNIVGIAAELETIIINEKEELARVKADKKLPPAVPKKEIIQEPKYVTQIDVNKKELFAIWASDNAGIFKFFFFNNRLLIKLILSLSLLIGTAFGPVIGVNSKTGGLIFFACCVALFVFTLIINKTTQNLYFNSGAYREDINRRTKEVNEKLQKEYREKCQKAEEKYNADLNHYNNNVLPKYQKELAVWKGPHDAKLAFIENDLKENIDTLNLLYSNTQLIPSAYRTVDRLTWIYEDMSTSGHDIERSIDLLNSKEIKEELVNIQHHVDDLRRDLREGFVGIYLAIQQGNEIQSEMLSDLEQIRKSVRIGNYLNVGNLIQNHNSNKMLSKIQGRG